MSAACTRCGCTEERACAGGCAWVEPGLCSSCVPSIASILEDAKTCADAAQSLIRQADAFRLSDRRGSEMMAIEAERASMAAANLRALAAIAARLPDPRLLHMTSVFVDAGAVLAGDELDVPGRIVVPR